ncbi:cytochrome P450 [Microdochium trichocladiopsis]|uniref:Cytochrome P450 n=1 Tax=Microdochium trichocladiopsis TaxID=1682393 RepID=A0A9P9BZP5_9PEZI|nr:cytochrome P450 [Microdochium trichocladiopsis]KAH7040334.1 cytochrome P450 [Microdochium trichocladiopsis]
MAAFVWDERFAGAARPFLQALATALAVVVVRSIYRGVRVRLRYKRLARQGIPIMPHSWLFGHIPLVARFRREFPSDLHISHFQLELNNNHQKYFPGLKAPPPVTYLDVWPLADPICLTLDPAIPPQYTQTKSLPKAEMVRYFMRPLCDDRDLVTLEGNEWKLWRSRFNPGFSARNIMALVPTILEEVDVFVRQLEQLSGPGGSWGNVFQLEKKAMNLTFDVIGRAALDIKFNEQSRAEPGLFKNAFFSQLSLMVVGASINSMVSRRLPSYARKKAKNAEIMDAYLIPYVQEREAVVKDQTANNSASKASEKIIIDLALQSIEKDGESDQLRSQPGGPLMQTLLAQLKVFLFAGHDTTASTIAFGFHLLSKNPECLAKLRAEHDSVFGATAADIQSTRAQIEASPQLLNQLPYTTAVIKETLRIHPPAASWRQGQPGFFLSVPGSDIPHPTEGFMILDATRSVQQRPGAWERAGEFVPERFLATTEAGKQQDVEIQAPPASGWRPFEHGPRNCIGQELAMTQLRLVLALVARRFDIECAWDKWDALQGRTGGATAKNSYNGERLYAYGESTAHCKDNMPAHVRLRDLP